MRTGLAGAGLIMVLALVGCSSYQVVPSRLKDQVNKDVQYKQVEQAPGAYEGQTVVWGGEIVGIGRRDENTSVEILHLPLDRTLRPLDAPTASRGRFIAIDAHGDITDADKLREGTLVTVIGEVQGLVPATLDQDRHDIPALLIRDMTAWDHQIGRTHYSGASPFIGYRPFIFWDSRRVASE
jgi:starvation-inducible outer membrane lipoprotein